MTSLRNVTKKNFFRRGHFGRWRNVTEPVFFEIRGHMERNVTCPSVAYTTVLAKKKKLDQSIQNNISFNFEKCFTGEYDLTIRYIVDHSCWWAALFIASSPLNTYTVVWQGLLRRWWKCCPKTHPFMRAGNAFTHTSVTPPRPIVYTTKHEFCERMEVFSAYSVLFQFSYSLAAILSSKQI